MRALGLPTASKRVTEPRGVVDAELLREAGGVYLSVEDDVDIDPWGDLGSLFVEATDNLLRPIVVSAGASNVTIFTPMPLLQLAGMIKVVEPSLRFKDVRCGW